jgi:lipid-A-disaccharide synthase
MTDLTTEAANRKHIMIIAGEASGDMHGAGLVRAMLSMAPDLHFFGMGGRELKAAGVELVYDAAKLSVVGATEVFSHLGDILAARRLLMKQMQERKPALLIIIDFPDFNLMLAKRARKLGIPVFYYISPQVWAWRQGRVGKIGKLTDRIAVILPFEKDFYRDRGVAVDFVGHPLVDTVTTTMEKEQFRESLKIVPGTTVVGLLPGSRKKEIISLLPVFLGAAKHLSDTTEHEYVFVIPKASTVSRQLLEENGIRTFRDQMDIKIVEHRRYDLMAACDAVVAASGTVTLELAILNVPTVVTYRVSPRTYFLGRLLVRRIQWFSLVNLIAGRTVIPELLQDEVIPENIARELSLILGDEKGRHDMLQGFDEVRAKLGKPGTAGRAAEIALSLVGQES